MLNEILVTALALLAGISCGWWWFGGKDDDPRKSLEKEIDAFTRSAERVMMAICQVHDVASGVACDVGNHSTDVGRISSELESLRKTEAGSVVTPAISVIDEMLGVNEKLQQKLAAAEEKLTAQTQEIASQQPSDSGTDSLTGLPNRRAFDHELTRRFAEWQSKSAPFSVMVVDVDGFKEFNDTHGQQAGDEILRHIGRKLYGFVLDKGVVCRFARAEFVVIVPQPADQAVDVALRAQTAIDAMRVAWEGKRLNATISFGLAQTTPGEDAAGLLRRAADALYAANKAGRSQGYLHDGNACRPANAKPEPIAGSAKQVPGPLEIQLLQKLPNREQLVKELERRLADSEKYGLPLSLISIDVSEFDAIRADQGQEESDVFANAIAVSLKDAIREIDYLARVAPSRFAVILPGSTEPEAKQIAKRIDTAAANRKVQLGSATVGVALELKLASYKNSNDAEALRRLVEAGPSRQVRCAPMKTQLVS
jgi:diguanylate cyclase